MADVSKQLAKAKDAVQRAMNKAELARKKLDIDCRTYRERHSEPVYAAQREVRGAIAAVTHLELAQAGIVPMETIAKYQGQDWAVRVRANGYAILVPVTKDGKLHMGRNEIPPPYRLSLLNITPRKMVKPDA